MHHIAIHQRETISHFNFGYEIAVKEEEKVLELSDEGMIGWQRDERGKELRRIGLL